MRFDSSLVAWVVGLALLPTVVGLVFPAVEIPWVWLVVAALVAVSFTGIHVIPVVHYGLEKLLDKRTGRAVREGLRFTYPLVGSFELFKIKLQTTKIGPFTSTSFDKLDMKVEGSIQWWPDRTRLSRFIEVDEATITKGLVDAVQSRVGELAGGSTGADFYRNRAALSLIINCHLRLAPKDQPDLSPYQREDSETQELVYDLAKFSQDGKYLGELRKKFGKERQQGEASSISEIEELYGIEIKGFFLADVNFTEETRRALEAQRQREYQMAGATEVLDWKLEQATRLSQELKLEPKDAIDAADVTVEQVITEKGQEPRVTKRIFSIGDARVAAELLRELRR